MYIDYFSESSLSKLGLPSRQELVVDIRKDNNASGPEHGETLEGKHGELIQRAFPKENPKGKKSHGKEVPEKDEGLRNDAGEKANGAVDNADAEVAETATLEDFEVWVCHPR